MSQTDSQQPDLNCTIWVKVLRLLPNDYRRRWDVAACAGFMATYGDRPMKIARAMHLAKNTAIGLIAETKRVMEPLLSLLDDDDIPL